MKIQLFPSQSDKAEFSSLSGFVGEQPLISHKIIQNKVHPSNFAVRSCQILYSSLKIVGEGRFALLCPSLSKENSKGDGKDAEFVKLKA